MAWKAGQRAKWQCPLRGSAGCAGGSVCCNPSLGILPYMCVNSVLKANCIVVCPKRAQASAGHTLEPVGLVWSSCLAGREGERLQAMRFPRHPPGLYSSPQRGISNQCFPNCALKRCRFPPRALLRYPGQDRGQADGTLGPNPPLTLLLFLFNTLAFTQRCYLQMR